MCEPLQSDIIDKVRKKTKKDLYSPSCPEELSNSVSVTDNCSKVRKRNEKKE
jgi:hypothetical protein